MGDDTIRDHPIFSLTPGVVYWMADGMRTRRGLDYLQRRRVLEFAWEKDGGRLRAVVLGMRKYTVRLDEADGQIRCECNCEDAASGAVCKHAVAAAAAFFAATRGTRFLNVPPPANYLEGLRQGILGGAEVPRAEVVKREKPERALPFETPVSERALGLAFVDNRRWRVVGLRATDSAMRQDDWEVGLRTVCLRLNVGSDACEEVIRYVEETKDPLPVWLRLNGKWNRINGILGDNREVTATLTRQKGEVTATFRFESASNRNEASEVTCGLTSKVGLTRDARLVRLEASPLVRMLGVLPYVLLSEGRVQIQSEYREPLDYLPWTVPAESYNECAEVFFDDFPEAVAYEGVTFVNGKRKIAPKPAPVRFGIHFDRDESDDDEYVATVHWEEPGFSVPLEAAAQALDYRFSMLAERRLFANRQRAGHLAKTLLALAAEPDKKERQKLAREAARRANIPQYRMAYCAKALFRDVEEELKAVCRWVFARPAETRGAGAGNAGSGRPPPWVAAEIPQSEAIYWELFLAAVFVPNEVRERFRGGEPLRVSRNRLAAGLPEVFRECRERGASLFLDGRPVSSAPLEVSVAMETAAGKQDWFELKPEIRLAGKALSPEDWEAIADGNGIARTADGPVVIDIDSLERLNKARKLLRSRKSDGDGDNSVQVPRLQIFEWLDLKRHGIKIKLPAEARKVLESLARFRKMEPAPLPSGLRADLRDYQKSGYDWFAFLYRHRFGACLADDMGLGKTVQAIALFVALKEGTVPSRKAVAKRPHLVVAPASLMFNWRSEIERFAPGLSVSEYTGGARSPDFRGIDVVLTTYEIVRRDRSLLREKRFHVLVFDEAQAVKNRAAARHKAVRDLAAECRICLTGTPVENHLGEYRAILDLALPGIFDDLEGKAKKGGAEALEDRVLARSRPFVLRRTKTAVLSQLPAKTETDVMLDLAGRQKALYVREVARVREEVAAAFNRMTAARAGVVALSALNRLRLLCVSPALVDPKESPVSPKFDFARDAVVELLDEGNAVLVFSQFVKALDLFEACLRKEGVDLVRLEGKTSQKQRKERVQRFQSGEGPSVFLLSLKAGGVGLNLTRANHVIHLDPWWNPAVESQASDRAHRIGQERKVLIQRLSMRGTIEEKIAALKADKKALYQRVLGSDEKPAARAALTREDLAFLLDEEE